MRTIVEAASRAQVPTQKNYAIEVNDWLHHGVLTPLRGSGSWFSSQLAKVTATSGPNGNIDFFNCGIEGGGWNPPYIAISQLKAVDLRAALNDGNSPFHACKNYISTFEKYAWEHGYPPILLAAFAMQESSCNPNTTGGGGEMGLMQITPDKCGGAPGGNCKDPDFNIRTGAAYFAKNLKEDGGNVLLSIGRYNGWRKGMTKADATHAANIGLCRNQNNLDYFQQFLNGWIQNRNAYDHNNRLGKYFNLDRCN
ncbi:glycoside hydrolase family 23 protein [Pterulicium gracile]|uniref:Glycoside hydrolase family 23 protein n=1 Tax=Pterulicium gracile TaxID=1884261 RepID=A0A5C3QPJ3_9AGAR|nr:glycoside hydrolase family 23 protein [Pterula gracilis]